MTRGTSALRVCALLLSLQVAEADACSSGQYTTGGDCCKPCPPGTRVAVECGQGNTKCAPCQDGATFAVSEGSRQCHQCARCPPGVREVAPCTATRDTRCDCGSGFYLWRKGNGSEALCAPCSACDRGHGVARPCGPPGDTLCHRCPPGTYSDENSPAQPCLPCTRCQEHEVELRACQHQLDAICMDKEIHIMSRPADSASTRRPAYPGADGAEGSMNSASGSGSPRLTPQDQAGNNNIVVYVSVLVAVVLGLLVYVAYKCWRSWQQKQALVKARAGELGTAGEGEKLHSDSGVFLDSHSLQEAQPSKGSKRDSKQDTRLYANLPPQRQEEVEHALLEGGPRGSWKQLAAALGYEQERVELFGRGEDPVHTLLSDWAQQEGSTLGLLCSALGRVERPDVVTVLTTPAQGVSVV